MAEGVSSERFQEGARFPRGPSRTYRQGVSRPRGVPLADGRPPVQKSPDVARNPQGGGFEGGSGKSRNPTEAHRDARYWAQSMIGIFPALNPEGSRLIRVFALNRKAEKY